MIETIAVPLDGSTEAERVLPYATAIARGLGAEVVLLHIIGGSRLVTGKLTGDAEQKQYLERLQVNSRRQAQGYLDKHTRALDELGAKVKTTILYGDPSNVLVEYGASHRPDIIAISTQGRSGMQRTSLGSVAAHLLSNVRVPLLLVHPDEPVAEQTARIARVVVPLDTSELAEAALPTAQDLARGLDATIDLVIALPTESQLYLGSELMTHPADVIQRAEDSAKAYLSDVRAGLEADGHSVKSTILHGDPASAVYEYTSQQAETLVAMATHGRSGLGRWVLGSVTDKVARLGGAPILVVRPER